MSADHVYDIFRGCIVVLSVVAVIGIVLLIRHYSKLPRPMRFTRDQLLFLQAVIWMCLATMAGTIEGLMMDLPGGPRNVVFAAALGLLDFSVFRSLYHLRRTSDALEAIHAPDHPGEP